MAKFCGNCGAKLEDFMNVCGYCGTPCVPPVHTPTHTHTHTHTPDPIHIAAGVKKTAKSGGLKKLVPIIVAVVVLLTGIFAFSSFSTNSCDWCNDTPTKAFKTHDGGKSYVCSDCRKNCAWCGNRAKKHYENALGMVVFVCNDCYEDIAG